MAFILSVLRLKINCYSYAQMHRAWVSISSRLLATAEPSTSSYGAGDRFWWVWRVYKAFPWEKLRFGDCIWRVMLGPGQRGCSSDAHLLLVTLWSILIPGGCGDAACEIQSHVLVVV